MSDDDRDLTPVERANKLIPKIMIGRYDGGLVEIAKACAARRKETGSAWQWRITFDGDTWDQDTVTTGELAAAEEILGDGTSYMQLDPRLSMRHRIALLVAHLHKSKGVKLADAARRAEQLTHQEQDAMVDMYEVAAVPKDGASPTS